METKIFASLPQLLKRYRSLLLLFFLGAGLLLLSGEENKKESDTGQKTENSGYSLDQTEEDLAEILTQIDGAGRVQVMLTSSSGSEQIYQENKELSYSGSRNTPEDYQSVKEVVLLEDEDRSQIPLLKKEIYPEYIGALIVCDGAENPGTALQIKNAVSVLTGLGSDRISVVKHCKS